MIVLRLSCDRSTGATATLQWIRGPKAARYGSATICKISRKDVDGSSEFVKFASL